MINLLIVLISVFTLFSCKQNDVKMPKNSVNIVCIDSLENQARIDSLQQKQTRIIDSIKVNFATISANQKIIESRNEKLYKQVDSLKKANNLLGKELLHKKMIITNAKYYLNIANKNPSQQKFLRGWMNRALNQ